MIVNEQNEDNRMVNRHNRGLANGGPARTLQAVVLGLAILFCCGFSTAFGQGTPQDVVVVGPDAATVAPAPEAAMDPAAAESQVPYLFGKLPRTVAAEGTLTASSSPFYIYVEKGSFTITIYKLDDQGEHTVPVHAWRTAIGRTPGRTPTGIFTLGNRVRWRLFDGPVYVQYSTQYDGSLSIHSSLYSSEDIDNLYPSNYRQIGEMVTSGCLRTTAEAAYFIYTYCPPGTIVEVVNGSPRGTYSEDPPPISSDHHWIDPTDPLYPSED